MSKRIDKFFDTIAKNFDIGEKLAKSHTPGSRILPSRNNKNDASYGLRLDAGELVDGKRNVYLQVNSQIDTPGLQNWRKKHSTHAKLAIATFDTTAEDKSAEADAMMEKLRADAKENAKNSTAAD